ncbi:unnamed protein product [marine sediment metagenome]|uniref:Uncharacterized protein n=1 Tax=marine sediment metagenome TaxID=412755 RepID=X0W9M7_9ZZZZ
MILKRIVVSIIVWILSAFVIACIGSLGEDNKTQTVIYILALIIPTVLAIYMGVWAKY